ncbi:DUF1249 domain-containing protein [Pelagibaculum spongiae]|uniref:DUF1249 domain-containing protein n=1 Tax=Pelagibaculum spongiae TaxID=2080658 RepID=UPI001314F008|nr:DUF1249 domain-containing protein [Pelagibaculum spongiae]
MDSAHLNWGVGEQADRLLIKVTQRCRYTTMLELQQPQKQAFWLPDIVMQLRLYHDARLAEVTGYQNVRNIKTCYEWPNPKMLQPDEKVQQNQLLAEWLELCLQHGWLSEPVPRIK